LSTKNTNQTQPTPASVDDFLGAIPDAAKRADCLRLREMMEEITGEPAVLWGPSIVGFGTYHYRYDSGREGDAPAVGFSPRAANITVYVTGGFDDLQDELGRLGKHKIGKGCLYLKRLSDVDEGVLTELIRASVAKAALFDVAG